MKIDGEQSAKRLAVMRGPKNELSVYALNPTDAASEISVAGIPAGVSLHCFRWNADAQGKTSPIADISIPAHGELKLSLCPWRCLC